MTAVSKFSRFLAVLTGTLGLLAACGGGDASVSDDPTSSLPPNPPVQTPPSLDIGGFKVVSEDAWTPVAVNKVISTFALGGHASDAQILLWSEQHPVTAIQEILTFAPHNLKLSPAATNQTDQLDTRDTSLESLARFWASDDPANGIPVERRALFDYSSSSGWLEHLWPTAVTTRGMNPFLHKVAYFEANQHMAVNTTAVPVDAVIRYYDDIARALSDGKSYDQVLAVAAGSAAIAHQYGHRFNVFQNDQCACNEDFAREFYQLFFAITGAYSPDYHETVTIKNTAKALTDFRLQRDAQDNLTPDLVYGSQYHPAGPLEMLETTINGTNAQERLVQLSSIAINHPESLTSLPLILVRGLADDTLDADGEEVIRTAWSSMTQKDLLLFLRAYAISPTFHSASRTKYWTSVERRLLVTNKISTNNDEIYHRVYSVVGHLLEGIHTFQPSNNVFGDQTGGMAADSPDVFLQNYNQTTDQSFHYRRYSVSEANYSWTKDWRNVIDTIDGRFTVEYVADYLWQRLISDGGKNFGVLERAHLYALLGTGSGLAGFLDPDNLEHIYTEAELSTADIAEHLNTLGAVELMLDSANASELEITSKRIGQAVSFVAASPYMFYQEGN